ncbi:hypothetical protein INR49_024959 [Caranx melampygus]|nr:hypothetical protein INR49_024959 [Caranx melampygus]
MQVDAVFSGVRLRKMRNYSRSTSSGLTQLRKGRERKEKDRISEMSILQCEQRHLFMHSPSACVVVRRQAGVETSSGRTEEFSLRNWLLTGTLRGGLKLKDPTGPISCHLRAAVVTTLSVTGCVEVKNVSSDSDSGVYTPEEHFPKLSPCWAPVGIGGRAAEQGSRGAGEQGWDGGAVVGILKMPAASTMTGGRALLLCTNTDNCIYQSVNGLQCCGLKVGEAPSSVVPQPQEVCGSPRNRDGRDTAVSSKHPLSPLLSLSDSPGPPDDMLAHRRATTTTTDPRTPAWRTDCVAK